MSKISDKLIELSDAVVEHFKLPEDSDTYDKIQEIIISNNLPLDKQSVINYFIQEIIIRKNLPLDKVINYLNSHDWQ